MIRIEVHGMANMSEFGSQQFAFKVEILDAIKEKHPYMLKEISVIRCLDFGINADGLPQTHFLRIYGNNLNCTPGVGYFTFYDHLIKALSPLGLEIEFVKLEKFHPAQ